MYDPEGGPGPRRGGGSHKGIFHFEFSFHLDAALLFFILHHLFILKFNRPGLAGTIFFAPKRVGCCSGCVGNSKCSIPHSPTWLWLFLLATLPKSSNPYQTVIFCLVIIFFTSYVSTGPFLFLNLLISNAIIPPLLFSHLA